MAIRLSGDHGPSAGAASAIHWQLWLEDARRRSAGLWREAIHFLYWAAIRGWSRNGFGRRTGADAREYLALVAATIRGNLDWPRLPGALNASGMGRPRVRAII